MVQSLSKKLATGAFAALVASTLSFPSLALALESGTVGGTDIANGTENSGEGWSYDGADTIALVDYVGDAIYTVGTTVITLEGENTVTGGIVTEDGDLTIKGDTSVPAEQKPVLNLEKEGEGLPNQIVTMATDSDSGINNITIEGATVNSDYSAVIMGNDVTIDNSYVGVANPDEEQIILVADGKGTVKDSEVELGKGFIASQDTLVIDNSNITATPVEYRDYAIYSYAGIELKNVEDVEILTEEITDDITMFYIATKDGAPTIKATGTPGYYTGTKATALPATGDTTATPAVIVIAAASLAVVGLSVRRMKEER